MIVTPIEVMTPDSKEFSFLRELESMPREKVRSSGFVLDTLGSYSQQSPNCSACRCYNSLMNAGSLLWIAEAVGIDKLTVKQAYEAAVAAGDYRRACGAIRIFFYTHA